MQDRSSDVFGSGKILFHADGFSDVHRGKQNTTETNKQTSQPKNILLSIHWDMIPVLIKALTLAFGFSPVMMREYAKRPPPSEITK